MKYFYRLMFCSILLAGPRTLCAQAFTSDLPLVVIDTKGQQIVDDPKISVHVKFIDNGDGQLNHSTDPGTDYEGNAGLEYRGNSTLGGPDDKNSMTLETWTRDGRDTSVALFGMPAEEDWILHASSFDRTFLRGPLSFEIWRRMDRWASRTRFVEVVLNGRYHGLYILMEKIKRDKNRLDIANLKTSDISGDELTGGYIIRLDWHEKGGWDSNYDSKDPKQKLHFQYYDPKDREVRPQQAAYIAAFIDSFETAVFAENYRHPNGQHYMEFMDPSSWVDLFILNELSKSVDAYKLSSFIYKDKRSKDGRLNAGPVWDFDLAWKNADYCGNQEYMGWTWPQTSRGCDDLGNMPRWWERLLAEPLFRDMVCTRWTGLLAGFLQPDSLNAWLDAQVPGILEAVARDHARWGGDEDEADEYAPVYSDASYLEQVDELKAYIRQRIAWMDRHIPGSCYNTVPATPADPISATIYPNPATESLGILLPKYRSLQLAVYDMYGKRLLTHRTPPTNNATIQLGQLATGYYILELRAGDQSQRIRFMKIRP